jgi:hypothetical protein
MAKNIVIDGVTYAYPTQGERAWGGVATATMVAVANKLAEVSNDSDIPLTEAALLNNQSSFANVPGLVLDGVQTRSVTLTCSLYRTDGASDLVEEFELYATRSSVGAGSWTLSQEGSGNAQVIFDILSTGQIQYKSSNYAGQVGDIVFQYRGIVTPQ